MTDKLEVTDEKTLVAYNLTQYRKAAKLTQQELADKLGYTDKAVSKWERGEALPDLFVLKQIADIYNVSLDDFLKNHDSHTIATSIKHPKKRDVKHFLIALISVALIWFIATIAVAFTLIFQIDPPIVKYIYMWAIPISAIVALVFNVLWGKMLFTAVIVSVLDWTVCLALYVTIDLPNLWTLFLVGAAMQIVIIIWFVLQAVRSKIKKDLAANKNG